MAKYPISKGVPKNVSVSEPKITEIHVKLGGSEALAGSPAGSEARPNPHVEASFKAPGVPRAN